VTILTDTSKLTRETATFYRRRPLVVSLRGRYLEIREKGRRTALNVEYATLYEFAAKLKWRQEQAEKKQNRRRR
jgi:hypothetical protein